MKYEKTILRLEQEIKNLHYNPTISIHSFSDAGTKEFFNGFWNIHVKPVVEYSKQMAKKYNADVYIVWMGAILHDIARLEDMEPHDEIGSKKAYKLLIDKGFSNDIAKKVKHVVLRHRCKKYPPKTIEEKIVATADAIAHFLPPFYFWIGKYSNKSFSDILIKNNNKIKRDYRDKIFFEDEKRLVREQYDMLKKWFNFKNQ